MIEDHETQSSSNGSPPSGRRRTSAGLEGGDDLFGTVTERFPNAIYSVELKDGRVVQASLSGKIRKNFIAISIGDKVKLETTSTGRTKIVYRIRTE